MRTRRLVLITLSLALAAVSLTPPASARPSPGVAPPPSPTDLVAATNAMLRTGDVTGPLAVTGRAGAYRLRTGFSTPPGGQDPLPVCVYGARYTAVFIPLKDAVGYASESKAVMQDVYTYPSAAAAQSAWKALSARIEGKCTGTHDLGDGMMTTLRSTPVAGPSGAPRGWGVLTRGETHRYSVVHLVGDSIQMVSVLPDASAIGARTVTAANALARSLAVRWAGRANAPITQDALLTQAQTTMLTPADVPPSLPIASPQAGGWSEFSGMLPGEPPYTCNDKKRIAPAGQSFVTVLGSSGDVFDFDGAITHFVDAYADVVAARKAWRAVRSAVLACNEPTRAPASATVSTSQVSSGTSGLEIEGVPGVWSRVVDTYPPEAGSTCPTAGGKQGPCPLLATKAYTITLLVGTTIQSLTYGRSREGTGTITVDQLAVNTLAEQLAGRWVSEPNTADTADTRVILEMFKDLNEIPRCSKDEGPISAYLLQWAKDNGLPATRDAHNNVFVTVPGSSGRTREAPVALQAHMDMVCAKTAASSHDFATDPIEYVRDGDWLHANQTTLGADDGIGIALAMYLATEPGLSRPPLELVFTTDEEMDMSGAAGLAPDSIRAKRYINIDWETEGSVALGGAGGMKRDIALAMDFSGLDDGWDTYRLEVTGLRGGHSGLYAGKGRASANVLLAQILSSVDPLRVATFDGGTADNAFAPSATAVFAVPRENAGALADAVRNAEDAIRAKNPDEKGLSVSLSAASVVPGGYASKAQSRALVDVLLDVPQDVYEWSTTFPGLPETSNNIGLVRTSAAGVTIKTFARSFSPSKLLAFSQLVDQSARQVGGTSTLRSAFPTWPPDPSSKLYKAALAASEKALGVKLKTIVVHAGLECGFVAEKFPGMEIVSLGPTLVDVHTPDERLNVPSVDRVLRLLREMLKEI